MYIKELEGITKKMEKMASNNKRDEEVGGKRGGKGKRASNKKGVKKESKRRGVGRN